MDPTGTNLMFYVFALVTVASGIVVIVLKSPLRSLAAAFVQLLSIFLCLGAQGDWVVGGGVFLVLGILYVRSIQFLRAMEPRLTQTRHRLRYSQVLGLILGLCIGLLLAINLIGEAPIQVIVAWSLFAIGMTGVLARRNAFHVLMSLQIMFNATVFMGFPVQVFDLNYDLVWVLVYAVGMTLYWMVGWPFVATRLLANRSLDIDDAHLLKS